jgi:hypothetical protein
MIEELRISATKIRITFNLKSANLKSKFKFNQILLVH